MNSFASARLLSTLYVPAWTGPTIALPTAQHSLTHFFRFQVLATDIFDPELNDLRKKRWNQAFAETSIAATTSANDARATVVIEHIMQASDVCHTMQHWHVYRRHNYRLFTEIAEAYRDGRCAANPAEFWYEGKLSLNVKRRSIVVEA